MVKSNCARILEHYSRGGEVHGGRVKQTLPAGVLRHGPGTQHLGWQSQRGNYRMGQGAGFDVEGGMRPSAVVQGPRTASGVRTFAEGGEVPDHHPAGFCPACGYDHGSQDGEMIAGISPPDDMGISMCPACGYAYGGEVSEPANLDATVMDPEEERRRFITALQRGGY